MEQQVSDLETLQARSAGVLSAVEPHTALPVCLVGQCMVKKGNGFEIRAAAGADCAIFC